MSADIKKQLIEIAESIIEQNIDENSDNIKRTALHIILSESHQAINFINIIEDEFEIEFDDDEIDNSFFQSFDNIEMLITKHLK